MSHCLRSTLTIRSGTSSQRQGPREHRAESVATKGYHHRGCARSRGRARIGTRVAYETFVGEIPAGMGVLHKCDVPPCINPEHLFVGSALDNVRDAARKGRLRQTFKDPAGSRNLQSKLTEAIVREARAAYSAGGLTIAALAKRYGVSCAAMSAIINRRRWPHV